MWKRDLKEQLLFLRQHGALGGAPGANFLGEAEQPAQEVEGEGETADDTAEILAMLSPEQQEELQQMPLVQQVEALALQRQFRGRFAAGGARAGGARPKAKAKPKAKPAPRPAGQVRCANCGAEGHATVECRKARVEFKDRPCFECGKMGHCASDCPKKLSAGMVGQALPKEPYALCIGCDDGCGDFTAVVRRGGRRVLGEVMATKVTVTAGEETGEARRNVRAREHVPRVAW